jgi:hypothetical protein
MAVTDTIVTLMSNHRHFTDLLTNCIKVLRKQVDARAATKREADYTDILGEALVCIEIRLQVVSTDVGRCLVLNLVYYVLLFQSGHQD